MATQTHEEVEPAEQTALTGPGAAQEPPAEAPAKRKPVKTTYVLFEEVQAFLDDGKDEGGSVPMWLLLGEYTASGAASALTHHFDGEKVAQGRRFHAVPKKSTRTFLPPNPNPLPSFRESSD